MTSKQAYTIASQWGSYMRDGDPGAVFYTFPGNAAHVQDAAHRLALIEYTKSNITDVIERLIQYRGRHYQGDSDLLREYAKNVHDLAELLHYFEVAPTVEDMDDFVKGYAKAMLFTAPEDDDGKQLDSEYDWTDFSAESLKKMTDDCTTFRDKSGVEWTMLMKQPLPADVGCSAEEYAGHNFALTRNHHGTGFWDRGYPKKLANALTKLSQAFGESNVYEQDGALEIE